MTVAELIQALSQRPPDSLVVLAVGLEESDAFTVEAGQDGETVLEAD